MEPSLLVGSTDLQAMWASSGGSRATTKLSQQITQITRLYMDVIRSSGFGK